MEFYDSIVICLLGSYTVLIFFMFLALSTFVVRLIRDLFRDYKDKKSK